MSIATQKRTLENFDFSPQAKACLKRLKKRFGTKKNAVETALFNLEKSTKKANEIQN